MPAAGKYAGKPPYPLKTGDNMTGQCSECGETFYGERAFDLHRYDDGVECVCHDPSLIKTRPGRVPWWLDDHGRWHYSKPMAQEERDRRSALTQSPSSSQEPSIALPGVSGTPDDSEGS